MSETDDSREGRDLSDFIVEKDLTLTLDCIAGQPEAVEALRDLRDKIEWAPVYKHWAARKPRGILFEGLPGTGKSFAVRCMMSETQGTLIEMKYEDIASRYVDHSIQLLAKIKDEAEKEAKNNPVVIFIDEFDAMAPSRNTEGIHQSDRKRVNFLLKWMDGGLNSMQNITFIATTNFKLGIDMALLRPGRFDTIINFKEFKPEGVAAAFKIHAKISNAKAGRNLFLSTPEEIETQLDHKRLGKIKTGASVEAVVQLVLTEKAKQHQVNIEELVKTTKEKNSILTVNEVLTIVLNAHTESVPYLISLDDIYKAIDSFVVKEDEKFKKEGRIIRGFHKEELDV